MEIINGVILGIVVIQTLVIGYLVVANKKLNDNVGDMSALLNKSVMASEEFRNNLSGMLDSNSRELQRTVAESSHETKVQLGYQKSFIETTMEKSRSDMADIKDRLEYLSTEVPIK